MRYPFATLSLLALAMLYPPPAQSQLRVAGRYAVTQSEVAHAIMKALGEPGLDLAQVYLLTDVAATQPSPILNITAISSLPQRVTHQHQFAVRLVCHTASVCLPFYAIASLPPDTDLKSFQQDLSTATSFKPAVALPRSIAQPKPPAVILRSGTRATLILEDATSRLAVPVIALENAAEGQNIRVASLDRKHIYTAHTVSATLLRGIF